MGIRDYTERAEQKNENKMEIENGTERNVPWKDI